MKKLLKKTKKRENKEMSQQKLPYPHNLKQTKLIYIILDLPCVSIDEQKIF